MQEEEKPVVYVDMDDTICDFTNKKNEMLIKNPRIEFPQSQYGFFTSLKPIPGALEGIKLLEENGYEVWILTRPSVHNPLCYLEKRIWVEQYIGIEMCHKLMIAPDKAKAIGDYLVDDVLWPKFKGKQLLFGSPEYKDWASILNYFIK